VNILRLYEDHYWGETSCSECTFSIYGTDETTILNHLECHHLLFPETTFTVEEDAQIKEVFGSVCANWFQYYRHEDTGELWAVRSERG
jgi:hypothetical protein